MTNKVLTVLGVLLCASMANANFHSDLAKSGFCAFVLSRTTEAVLTPEANEEIKYESQEIVNTIETQKIKYQQLQDKNGRFESQAAIQARRRIQNLKYYLSQKNMSTQAAGIYLELFHQVETAYDNIEKNRTHVQELVAQSDSLTEEAFMDELITLTGEINSSADEYGRGYEEYLAVKDYLEEVIRTNSLPDVEKQIDADEDGSSIMDVREVAQAPVNEYAERAKDVLSRLSNPRLDVAFPGLNLRKETASLSKYREMYLETPAARLANLNQAVWQERWVRLRLTLLVDQTLQGIQNTVDSLWPSLRNFVSLAVGLGVDTYTKDRYLPDIQMVIRTDKMGLARLDLLREITARNGNDKILVVFARLSSASFVYGKLMNQALELATNPKVAEGTQRSFAAFYQRMHDAQTRALALGSDLALYQKAAPGRKTAILISGFTTASAIYLSHHTALAQNVWDMLKGWLPGF